MGNTATRGAADEFLALLEVVRELRQRCPWDREQTLASASRHLIEEAYEAADAIEQGGEREIQDELGDLLVQVLFAANIAQEQRGLEVAAMLGAGARETRAAPSACLCRRRGGKLGRSRQELGQAQATGARGGWRDLGARRRGARTAGADAGAKTRGAGARRRDGLGARRRRYSIRSAKRLTKLARRSRSVTASMRPRRWAMRCWRWPMRRVSLAMTQRQRCGALAKSSPNALRKSSASPPSASLSLRRSTHDRSKLYGRRPSARLRPTSVEPALIVFQARIVRSDTNGLSGILSAGIASLKFGRFAVARRVESAQLPPFRHRGNRGRSEYPVLKPAQRAGVCRWRYRA